MAGARSDDHKALGQTIRSLRSDRGWTAENLADKMDANPRWVSACERGELNFTFSSLMRFAEALGMLPSELVDEFEKSRGLTRPGR